MCRKIRYLGALLLLCSSFKAVAQDTASEAIQIGSVQEAMLLAIQHNPTLSIYKSREKQATYGHKAAQSYLYPQVSASFLGQKNIDRAVTPLPGEIFGQPGQTIDVQFGKEYAYNTGLTVSLYVFNWQATLQAKIAKLNIELAQSQVSQYRQNLAKQVSSYFYNVLIISQALDLARENSTLADSIARLTQQKFDTGLIDKLLLNKALINKNSTDQTVVNNEILLDENRNGLKMALGLEKMDTITIAEEVDFKSLTLINPKSLVQDAAIETLKIQQQQALLNYRNERAFNLPKISLNGYFGKQQFTDAFKMDFNNGSWSNYNYVSLGFSWALFNGLGTHNHIKMAQIGHEVAQQQLQIEEREAQIKDEQLLGQYNSSIANVSLAADNMALIKDITQLSFQKYEQGLISLDSYYDNFQDYLDAQNQYLNALLSTYSYYTTILSRQNL